MKPSQKTAITTANTDFNSVDEYIASQPGTVQGALDSYQIPAYKLHGRIGLYFAGWRQHYSLYPTPRALVVFKDDLAPYKVNKGTIRFPLSQPVPVKLIERIAKFRAKEVAEREKAKVATPKKR